MASFPTWLPTLIAIALIGLLLVIRVLDTLRMAERLDKKDRN